ncbi:MAG: HD domain-containing protein [Candidatus Bathyarchaeaceae archaeon]
MSGSAETNSKIPYEFVKDPIYGYITLFEHEIEIIDTPSFQKLRRIKQLPSAHYIYPGATHTRFSHSLGVMHLSGMFVEQLLEPYGNKISENEFLHFFFLVRLWGLTHDLGHGPFSHTFDKVVLEDMGLNHEYMSSKIVQEDKDIAGIIDDKLKDYDINPKVLSEYLGKSREEWTEAKTLGKTEHSEAAFYYILKGFYSTDIIDYLLRDNLYTGAGYGNFDWQRLILSSHLVKNEIALEIKSRDTLDAFLLSRLFSFKTIYYHRWSRVVDHIIKDFLTKAKEKIDFKKYADDVKEYGKLDEQSIFYMPELNEIPERKMLMDRVIHFREIDQVVIPEPMRFLKEDDLCRLLSDKLKGKIPEEAYFIDTPNLHLNPMIGEEEVCVIDMSTSPPTTTHESIRKTSWGEVPPLIWTIRLYLRSDYDKIKDEVKQDFRALIEGQSKTRTHY